MKLSLVDDSSVARTPLQVLYEQTLAMHGEIEEQYEQYLVVAAEERCIYADALLEEGVAQVLVSFLRFQHLILGVGKQAGELTWCRPSEVEKRPVGEAS